MANGEYPVKPIKQVLTSSIAPCNMIKTILFDVGGVITNQADMPDFESLYRNFANRIGIDPQIVVDYHYKNINDMLIGKLTMRDFLNEVNKSDLTNDLIAIWTQEALKTTKLNTELLGIIDKLRKNYRLGILSDLTESIYFTDVELKIYDHFDSLFLSFKVGLKKPDKQFYLLALNEMKSQPAETIFIDDKAEYVNAAKELGLHGITYSGNNNLIEELKILGVNL